MRTFKTFSSAQPTGAASATPQDHEEKDEYIKVEAKTALSGVVPAVTNVPRDLKPISVLLRNTVSTIHSTTNTDVTTYELNPSSCTEWSEYASLYDEFHVDSVEIVYAIHSSGNRWGLIAHDPHLISGSISFANAMRYSNASILCSDNGKSVLKYVVKPKPYTLTLVAAGTAIAAMAPPWCVTGSVAHYGFGTVLIGRVSPTFAAEADLSAALVQWKLSFRTRR